MTAPTHSREPNRLINETSPYLRQHAYNPVQWHPWGEDALAEAKSSDRPIFLSIGYSACHWCHVMERESFENETIAELMNRYFVNIKVDREERPDLDQIYMNAVTALTGHGGWPMSVFLTPDGEPFFGGTYWPPAQRRGMPGFADILQKVHEAWTERRADVLRGASELTSHLQQIAQPQSDPSPLNAELLQHAESTILRAVDRRYGGIGSAPKFPHPMDLRLLLRCFERFSHNDAIDAARLTLDQMAAGGLYDQLGGGFHRYSTDQRWLVPHFEKMLYDNALLAPAYLEAWQLTGDDNYARIVRETLDYVLREMTQPQGGFYSTQDADSEGVEGKFFVWDEEEIDELLGKQEAHIFKHFYDVSAAGNWEGRNILHRPKSLTEAAQELHLDREELERKLAASRRILFDARSRRVPPARDDKILVSWNGMMIAAMSLGARILGEPRYAQAAEQAARFVLDFMQDDQGRLLHTWKDGQARLNAYLDDYACFIDGLAELFQATGEPDYLIAACDLADDMLARFQDPEQKGFFYTSNDHEELITRTKDIHDGATPSGNSMAATALLKLSRLAGRLDYEDKAIETLEMLAGHIARMPLIGAQALLAIDFLLGPAEELVFVEGDSPTQNAEALDLLRRTFLPRAVFVPHKTGDEKSLSPVLQPLLAGKRSPRGEPTLYVCERGACQALRAGVAAIREFLDSRNTARRQAANGGP